MFTKSIKKRFSIRDQRIFFRQLEVIIGSGIPLNTALDIIAKGETKLDRVELIDSISRDLENGAPLSTSLRNQKGQFTPRVLAYIFIGEESGSLHKVFDLIASELESDENTYAKLKSNLTYPLTVALLAFLAIAAMIYFFIPRMLQFAESIGTGLPPLLSWLSSSVVFLTKPWVTFLVIQLVAGVLALIWALFRTKKYGLWLDKIILKLPAVKGFNSSLVALQVCSGLYVPLKCGCPLVKSLKLVPSTLSNSFAATELRSVTQDVALKGSTLAEALRKRESFSTMLCDLVMCGEESGKLEEQLNLLRSFFEARLDEDLTRFSALIEPLVLITLGLTVGAFTLLFFLPITKVVSQL